jgi:hypothetical protein
VAGQNFGVDHVRFIAFNSINTRDQRFLSLRLCAGIKLTPAMTGNNYLLRKSFRLTFVIRFSLPVLIFAVNAPPATNNSVSLNIIESDAASH